MWLYVSDTLMYQLSNPYVITWRGVGTQEHCCGIIGGSNDADTAWVSNRD